MNRYLKLFFIAIAGACLLASPSIHAQIKNIYNSSEEDVAGITSLMSAVISGDIDGVKFFAKSGAELVNQKNIGGATPLLLACREGNLEIAKILIDNGANINATDNEGWTPLMRAALAGKKDVVDLLMTKDTQAAAVNSIGESAIFHATSSDCNECLSSIFRKFNFIKFMDISLLKNQLTDSFTIAKNHDNQVAQNILGSYLDRVTKASSLASGAIDQDKQLLASDSSTATEKKPVNVMEFILKTDGKKVKTTKVVDASPLLESKKKLTEGGLSQQEILAKKFKLIVGEEGKLVNKTKHKIGVVKSEESEARFVLIEKNVKDDASVAVEEISLAQSAPIGSEIYKLNRGPEGKLIKRRPIKKNIVAARPASDSAVITTSKILEPKTPTSVVTAPAAVPASAPTDMAAPVAKPQEPVAQPPVANQPK